MPPLTGIFGGVRARFLHIRRLRERAKICRPSGTYGPLLTCLSHRLRGGLKYAVPIRTIFALPHLLFYDARNPMGHTYTKLLDHAVYSTKERRPLIHSEWRDELYC